jgi:hypothetical protein
MNNIRDSPGLRAGENSRYMDDKPSSENEKKVRHFGEASRHPFHILVFIQIIVTTSAEVLIGIGTRQFGIFHGTELNN